MASIWGAALIFLMLPVVLLLTRSGSPVAARSENTERGTPSFLSSVTILAIASCAFCTIGMYGIQYHVVSILVGAGYSSYLAGMAFGATWLLSAAGSLVMGVAADRCGAKRVLGASLVAAVIGTLCLLGVSQSSAGLACVVVFVLLWGLPANSAFQLVPVILAEHLGSKHLGVLVGAQAAIAGIAGAGAPVVTGMIFDQTGGYRLPISLSALMTLIALILILAVRAPRQV
jgi:MFS family permease